MNNTTKNNSNFEKNEKRTFTRVPWNRLSKEEKEEIKKKAEEKKKELERKDNITKTDIILGRQKTQILHGNKVVVYG